MMVPILLAFLAALALGLPTAKCEDLEAGRFGVDAIFVHPIAGPAGLDSFRAQVSVTPVTLDTTFSKLEFLDSDITEAVQIGTGQVELTRARANLLRLAFGYGLKVDLGTFVRNMDQGMDWGGEIISVRLPIKLDNGRHFIIQPGLELGIHHTVAPVDKTAFHAAFMIEARAAMALIQDWLSTGVMGRVRYDIDAGAMSGFEEGGMGYLSLLLDRDHKLYARVYAGVEHQAAREQLGLPTVDVITGLGLFGDFGTE